jgi:hypothetical protein
MLSLSHSLFRLGNFFSRFKLMIAALASAAITAKVNQDPSNASVALHTMTMARSQSCAIFLKIS